MLLVFSCLLSIAPWTSKGISKLLTGSQVFYFTLPSLSHPPCYQSQNPEPSLLLPLTVTDSFSKPVVSTTQSSLQTHASLAVNTATVQVTATLPLTLTIASFLTSLPAAPSHLLLICPSFRAKYGLKRSNNPINPLPSPAPLCSQETQVPQPGQRAPSDLAMASLMDLAWGLPLHPW